MAITPVALPVETFQINRKVKVFKDRNTSVPLRSSEELRADLAKFVHSKTHEKGIEVVLDHKLSNGLIIPVFLPEKNMGLDVLSLVDFAEDKVGNRHCKQRLDQAKSQDIRFVQIFEDEWSLKREIVEHRVDNLIGSSERIYARNTEVREIPWGIAKELLTKTHIQGPGAGAASVLGLVYQGNVVAVMTLGVSRFEKVGPKDYELIRYSSVGTVIGGFSKLLKYFISTVEPERIISYSDARWSVGGVYRGNGFMRDSHSQCGYFWVPPGIVARENRIRYQKHKLKDVLEKFDPARTEKQNCEANGLKRIFDCGMEKWVMDLTD